MTTKITVAQCHGLRSALSGHGRAALGPLLWVAGRPVVAAAAAAAAAVQLSAKAWALSHFLRRFWSKSPGQPTSLYSSVNSGKRALISFLPPSESQAPWRDCEKPSSRATSRRRAPPRPPTTPLRLGELLSPLLFVSPRPSKETQKPLCGFLQRFSWNKYCLISLVLFV